VAVVRRQLGTRAVGHAGTLDPFATGLLVLLLGRATRLARFVEAASKRYDAVFRFGAATDTDDGTGTVIGRQVAGPWPSDPEIDAALRRLTGTIDQRPPAYSAKHVGGQRSHRLARAGVAVELKTVPVTVHALTRRSWQPPDLAVEAEVGKGTYLRAIARDLGELLGIPAHCAALRRTAIGPFQVAQAMAPTDVTAAAVWSPAAMVAHLPREHLDAAAVREVGFGRQVVRHLDATGPAALLAEDGRLVAMAVADGECWQPVVVLEPAA
jgi:tRNA pseudouridine55 synthase